MLAKHGPRCGKAIDKLRSMVEWYADNNEEENCLFETLVELEAFYDQAMIAETERMIDNYVESLD